MWYKLNKEYEELEKFLKDKGYIPKVNDFDGRVVFVKAKSQRGGNKIKLQMVVRVSFGAVAVKEVEN